MGGLKGYLEVREEWGSGNRVGRARMSEVKRL